ncbi:MAG: sulfatase [Planctomycetota bacterium]|nr:sulfatase [Planctomycetota bacterium]
MQKFYSLLVLFAFTTVAPAERPNIVWFVVDDMSANFSCYGETTIQTPHVDRLAREGVKFTRAYATSPVCSTFRSAMITGMYQTSIGSHHHRSGRGAHRIILPDGVQPVPKLFQDAGYYTCIGSGLPDRDYRSQPISTRTRNRLGKTDYNFDWDKSIYDSHDWSGRQPEQPFFMQVQLHGGKLRGASATQYENFDRQVKAVFDEVTAPSQVTLPPYYPRDPILLKDWSTYLDSVRITDHHVGLVMQRLRKEKLIDNTLIIFLTDHGISHARGKQFLYDEGTHIPLIIRGPGVNQGATRTDLVEHIDVAAVSLAAAKIEIPKTMQGQDLLAPDFQTKQVIFAARDRCGEAVDHIRSVRSELYLYIKNFYPQRPHLMPSTYKDGKLIIQRLRELHVNQRLNQLSEKLLFAPTRAAEELYLYGEDKWQTINLADDPQYSQTLAKHRQRLEQWIEETNDPGPETLEVYTLETEDQMKATKNKTSLESYRANAELYKRWAREGN